MKISFITDEATQSFDEAILIAEKCGLDGLELRSVDDTPIDSISPAILKKYRQLLNAHSLDVPCLSSSFFKCNSAQADGIKLELEKLQRLCNAADILECEFIRGFAFFKPMQKTQAPEELLVYFEQAASILHKNNKCLLLESDPSVNTTNHEQLANLLSVLKTDCFKAVYDPGNDLYDPCHEQPFPMGYEFIKPYIAHIHIKDACLNQANEPYCVMPGTGLVNYPYLLERIINDGYNAWLSLETHYRKDTALTEAQMRLPQGSAFSAGGAEAMEESATSLKKMLSTAYTKKIIK